LRRDSHKQTYRYQKNTKNLFHKSISVLISVTNLHIIIELYVQ
jgi:hypothetical protein